MDHHLRRLDEGINIAMPVDVDGYTGRECPNPDCLGYFLIKFGTGLDGEALPCHCPYCGHTSDHDQFWTQDQLKYAESVAMREVEAVLGKMFTDWDRQLRRNSRCGFIQLRLEYKQRSLPIYRYQEKELETAIICDQCTLAYKVFGVFAFCPDCGVHNTLQILRKSLELARKQLVLAAGQEDAEFAEHLIKNTLEDCVSAFDGFGREVCCLNASKSTKPEQASNLSFQNLIIANHKVEQLFGIRLENALDAPQWQGTTRCFQKRHLIAHKMGVVDQKYIDATQDRQAVVGRKIKVTSEEITAIVANLEDLGSSLLSSLAAIGNEN